MQPQGEPHLLTLNHAAGGHRGHPFCAFSAARPSSREGGGGQVVAFTVTGAMHVPGTLGLDWVAWG